VTISNDEHIAVLTSGGLDSCVLLTELSATARVTPVYVRFGLAWEDHERRALESYLEAAERLAIAPLVTLEMPIASVYGKHWSTTGEGVPAAAAPDIDVYLPGRNVLLIGLTSVWCAINGVSKIAIGSLDENPFPDATPEFFAGFSELLSGALSHPIEVIAPFRGQHKSEIIARNATLPLDLTLTCMNPANGQHCGECNKCFERQSAFKAAAVVDRTVYAG
jgi:7-cyano-7-deazaguanine synthase